MEIENEESLGPSGFRVQTMRVQFDIVSSLGEFHYDSDYRTCNEVMNILKKMGLTDQLLLFDIQRLDVNLDFTMVDSHNKSN
jgi:hypothetical protein